MKITSFTRHLFILHYIYLFLPRQSEDLLISSYSKMRLIYWRALLFAKYAAVTKVLFVMTLY